MRGGIMNPIGVEHCLNFINCHLQPPDKPVSFPVESPSKRAVTISRQSGCGAHDIAEKLAGLMQSFTPPDAPPWEVFDRNLVVTVLADHQLPGRVAQYMPEDRVLEINDIVDE